MSIFTKTVPRDLVHISAKKSSSANSRLSGRLRLPMDNGKCIMDNDCVAKGDDFKLFPKEIPQLSIVHYQLSIRASARKMAILCLHYPSIPHFGARINGHFLSPELAAKFGVSQRRRCPFPKGLHRGSLKRSEPFLR